MLLDTRFNDLTRTLAGLAFVDAQIINYLEAYRLEVGLLINFGETSLKYKRFLKNQPRTI